VNNPLKNIALAKDVHHLVEHIEQVHALLRVAQCPSNCDDGAIPHGPNPDGEWEAEQCQFCYERTELLGDEDED